MEKQSWFERNGLTIGTIVTCIIFLVSSLVGITVFAFTTFATKEGIEKRLDRLETKVDSILTEFLTMKKEK